VCLVCGRSRVRIPKVDQVIHDIANVSPPLQIYAKLCCLGAMTRRWAPHTRYTLRRNRASITEGYVYCVCIYRLIFTVYVYVIALHYEVCLFFDCLHNFRKKLLGKDLEMDEKCEFDIFCFWSKNSLKQAFNKRRIHCLRSRIHKTIFVSFTVYYFSYYSIQ